MSNSKSTSIEYKKRLIKTWNEIAPRYHKKWAKQRVGPFQSTTKLVSAARLRRGHKVLDLACGTGIVINEILPKIGHAGHVVGVDSSISAIKIAKKWLDGNSNVDFVLADVENLHFNEKFDAVTCQYALFFFPDAGRVLENIKCCLKDGGNLAITVHGARDSVPYFSSIIDVATKFIPDYLPPGAPDLDRFGTKQRLSKAVHDAGFTDIKIAELVFSYSPGTFAQYWSDYIKYLAKPLKEKINKLTPAQKKQMQKQVREKTLPYTNNERITFPWKVLVLSATKP
ncbi:MAG TPA: methyltransferase domain-containing protein [Candidatus Nitrosotenuis sp.]|nr:methyltransferase domain-containing protein [Candidatus Nitrosotenuis sp.]